MFLADCILINYLPSYVQQVIRVAAGRFGLIKMNSVTADGNHRKILFFPLASLSPVRVKI